MLSAPGNARIFLCRQPVSMRRSFDGLAGACRDLMGLSPVTGDSFVFLGKSRRIVKILRWEGDGFAIWSKRLERGQFNPRRREDGSCEIDLRELHMLLDGVRPARLYRRYGASE